MEGKDWLLTSFCVELIREGACLSISPPLGSLRGWEREKRGDAQSLSSDEITSAKRWKLSTFGTRRLLYIFILGEAIYLTASKSCVSYPLSPDICCFCNLYIV